MDAKDILGLPKTPPSLPLEKKSRPPKESQRKPDGISREVYALTGGLPPFIPAIDVSHLKPRSLSQEKITWRWLPFTSSARNDNLQLCHWAKIVNGVFPTGDYSFAKYNKSVDIVAYSDEEYEKHLSDDAWTREETDQLFELCKQFELRFIVIADRFSSPRTVEELKDRYYSVSRAIISARASSPNEVSSHPLIREAYNVKLEIERKRSLSMLLSHTKQQERKDSEVLAEAKRISDLRIAAKGAEERELAAASNPESNTTGKERSLAMPVPVDGDSSIMASLRMLPVYLRTYAFEQMVQSITSATGLRTVKRMEQSLQELGVNAKPRLVTRAVCKEHMDLRREILALLNLQKQYKEAENSSTQRLHAADLDRPDSSFCFAAAGERASKDLKRKGVGRASNSPASPAQHTKRPRKIKASDS